MMLLFENIEKNKQGADKKTLALWSFNHGTAGTPGAPGPKKEESLRRDCLLFPPSILIREVNKIMRSRGDRRYDPQAAGWARLGCGAVIEGRSFPDCGLIYNSGDSPRRGVAGRGAERSSQPMPLSAGPARRFTSFKYCCHK